MENNDSVFDNFDFGGALEKSLKQAVAFERGDTSSARIAVCEIPSPAYSGSDVRRMREDFCLSQIGLAIALGVSKRTVEAWEAGKSKPSNVANRLIYLLLKNRELLDLLVMPKTRYKNNNDRTIGV
jgi:putative transcriptional regulator